MKTKVVQHVPRINLSNLNFLKFFKILKFKSFPIFYNFPGSQLLSDSQTFLLATLYRSAPGDIPGAVRCHSITVLSYYSAVVLQCYYSDILCPLFFLVRFAVILLYCIVSLYCKVYTVVLYYTADMLLEVEATTALVCNTQYATAYPCSPLLPVTILQLLHFTIGTKQHTIPMCNFSSTGKHCFTFTLK